MAFRRQSCGLFMRQYPQERSTGASEPGAGQGGPIWFSPQISMSVLILGLSRTFMSSWIVLVGFARAGPSQERVPGASVVSAGPALVLPGREGGAHRLEAFGASPVLCVSFPKLRSLLSLSNPPNRAFLTVSRHRWVEGMWLSRDRGRRSRSGARPRDQSPLPLVPPGA